MESPSFKKIGMILAGQKKLDIVLHKVTLVSKVLLHNLLKTVFLCRDAKTATPNPRLSGLGVSFREVVHSDRTEETGVTKPQHSPEGPNEHPQECPPHAAASRGNGAVGH